MSSTQRDKIEIIYTLSVVLAFALLFFANAEQQEAPDGTVVSLGIGKAFYLPCGIALLCSFYIKRKRDVFDGTINFLMLCAIIAFFIHPTSTPNILEWTLTRFLFGILCFRSLRDINPSRFIKVLAIVGPIIIIPHYLLSSPFSYGAYRYSGFYGDSNFFAIAVNFLIVASYLAIHLSNKKIYVLCGVTTIVLGIPLILLGMSRGGIIGLSVVLFFIARDLHKEYKKTLYIIGFLLFIFASRLLFEFGDLFMMIEDRFSNETATARIEGIQSCLNVFGNCPELIPFGIGPGNTYATMGYYKSYGYICSYVIHNTYFSILYEMGIFAALSYVCLYWILVKRMIRSKLFLLLGLLLSDAMSLFTLPGACFMPSWILLFLLANNRIKTLYNRNPKEKLQLREARCRNPKEKIQLRGVRSRIA